MNRLLVQKAFAESKWLLLACCLGVFGFCWVNVWMVGRFEMSRFRVVVEQFRDYEHLSPVPFDQIVTYAGRISLTFGHPLVIMAAAAWAIARGSDAISGELSRGTMEMLLAQPVRRIEVLLSQVFVLLTGLALVCGAAFLGIYIGIQTTTIPIDVTPTWRLPLIGIEMPVPFAEKQVRRVPLETEVDAAVFVPAIANLFSLGVFLGGLSIFMSAWDQHRWRTIGLVVGLTSVQLAFKVVGVASPDLSWLRWFSFFSAYEPEFIVVLAARDPRSAWSFAILENGQWVAWGPLAYDALLAGLGTIGFFTAALIFCRRDLPAPL